MSRRPKAPKASDIPPEMAKLFGWTGPSGTLRRRWAFSRFRQWWVRHGVLIRRAQCGHWSYQVRMLRYDDGCRPFDYCRRCHRDLDHFTKWETEW
jgi:hypothetical protein